MDSIFHISDSKYNSFRDIKYPSDVLSLKKYKEYLYENKLSFDVSRLNHNDFNAIAALNLKKMNYIINSNYGQPTKDEYFNDLTQKNVLLEQQKLISKNSLIHVLNTTLLIDVDLYGKDFYFKKKSERLFSSELNFDKNE